MESDRFKYLRYVEVFGNEFSRRVSAVSAVIRLRAGQPWEKIPSEETDFFLFKKPGGICVDCV